jgi:spermidine/putrescine transport system permease protein
MAFAAFSPSAAKATGSQAKSSSRVVLALLLPGMLYLGMFFLIPLVSLIITSLETPSATGAFGMYDYAFDVSSYIDVTTRYLPQILRSFGYAFLATFFALVISYPLAYFIGVRLRPRPLIQKLTLTLVIAPFFISFLLRTIAWKQLLSDDSAVLNFLRSIHLWGEHQYFLGTPAAVVWGLTYNFIPFMTLPLYTSLERLDLRLLEAASDLYANPLATFRKVTLPLTLPGVISGTLLTFIPITGDYVNASRDFLGSSKTSMIGNMVEADFLQNADYPAASALSAVLMAVILVLVGVYVKRTGTEDLL